MFWGLFAWLGWISLTGEEGSVSLSASVNV